MNMGELEVDLPKTHTHTHTHTHNLPDHPLRQKRLMKRVFKLYGEKNNKNY